MQDIDVHATTAAGADAVWRLLADSSTWSSWAPLDGVEIVEPGPPDAPGEVRVMLSGKYRIRERIVEKDAPRRLTYTVEDGIPVRDYRAEIDVDGSTPGETRIRWHTRFDAKIPGTGFIMRRQLGKLTQQFADGLAEAAAR